MTKRPRGPLQAGRPQLPELAAIVAVKVPVVWVAVHELIDAYVPVTWVEAEFSVPVSSTAQMTALLGLVVIDTLEPLTVPLNVPLLLALGRLGNVSVYVPVSVVPDSVIVA